MGVDYYAHSGVGFKVKPPKKFQNYDEFDFYEHLDNVLLDSVYSYFETGEGAYTGEDNDYYVVLKDFKPVNDLEERVNELKNFLIEHDLIESSAEYDLVGGLEVS